MMNRLFNPFRFLAGGKALILGIVFIISSALLLYSGGMIQDSYVHIAPAQATLWQVIVVQLVWWIIPAILLYTGGIFLSSSRIRIIDILGTTAFAQLLYIPLIAPMLIPAVKNATSLTLQAIMQGVEPGVMDMAIIAIFGIWSFLFLALFYIWNYKAFSVSCNLTGTKAIVYYVAVIIVTTAISSMF